MCESESLRTWLTGIGIQCRGKQRLDSSQPSSCTNSLIFSLCVSLYIQRRRGFVYLLSADLLEVVLPQKLLNRVKVGSGDRELNGVGTRCCGGHYFH